MMKNVAAALLLVAASGAALAEDGAALFKAKCAACHGADGKGETPMAKALKVKGLVGTKLSAAEVEKIVAEGKPGTKMAPVKGLSPEQLKAVSAYARSLK
jgi:mono/diheme cytochrome c family protein